MPVSIANAEERSKSRSLSPALATRNRPDWLDRREWGVWPARLTWKYDRLHYSEIDEDEESDALRNLTLNALEANDEWDDGDV